MRSWRASFSYEFPEPELQLQFLSVALDAELIFLPFLLPRFDSRCWAFTLRPSSSATLWLSTEALAPLSSVNCSGPIR